MRVLAITILLTLAPAARADDWSQYIEKPGTTYTPMGATKSAPPAATPTDAKPAKKQVAQKPKAKKTKAPVKARRKK